MNNINLKNKKVKYIMMDISYYGKSFSKVKYYPTKENRVNFSCLREEDGVWFDLDLDGNIHINVHLFFHDRKWNTNCEFCERDVNGGWNHYYDSNIYCKNVKVKYVD